MKRKNETKKKVKKGERKIKKKEKKKKGREKIQTMTSIFFNINIFFFSPKTLY